MPTSLTPFADSLAHLSRENAGFTEALRRLQDQDSMLTAAMRPLLSEAARSIRPPGDEFAAALRATFADMQRTQVGIRAAAEAMNIPHLEMQRFAEETARTRSLLATMPASTFADLRRVSLAASDAFRMVREASEAARVNIAQVSEMVSVAHDAAANYRATNWSEAVRVARHATADALARVAETQGAKSAKGGGGIAMSDVQKVLAEESAWESIDDVDATTRGMPESARLITYIVILWLIKPLWDRGYTDFVLEWFGGPTAAEVRESSPDVREVAEIATLRCVLADVLNVRESPDETAERVTQLSQNYLLEVLRTEGDWAFVRFRHPEKDEIGTGWVATEFLSRELCIRGLP